MRRKRRVRSSKLKHDGLVSSDMPSLLMRLVYHAIGNSVDVGGVNCPAMAISGVQASCTFLETK